MSATRKPFLAFEAISIMLMHHKMSEIVINEENGPYNTKNPTILEKTRGYTAKQTKQYKANKPIMK